ncbi:MAG: TolB-like 6-bladed beta-propeller domain-containing protein, partial [Tannerellaceae bacterium]|nr:TolB-like 6-bladed beta-propeller domain-containing protein [Tannerellaceae bacterium]
SFSPIQIDRLKENTFAAISIGGAGLSRFILVDEEEEIRSKEGELPEKESEAISDDAHAFAYWGRITTNPKANKVAIGTNYAGIMQVYDCSTDKAELIKEHNLFLADYKESGGYFDINPQTRWGYLSMDSNDTYIFALYSGLNQVENPDGSFTKSNMIHVFDWDGNPVARLITDKQLSHICVDESTLYGYDTEIGDIVAVTIKGVL